MIWAKVFPSAGAMTVKLLICEEDVVYALMLISFIWDNIFLLLSCIFLLWSRISAIGLHGLLHFNMALNIYVYSFKSYTGISSMLVF